MAWAVIPCASVRDDAGHSLKSSVRHHWTIGTEDDAVLPTRGFVAQLKTELAGLGGDVNYSKHEASARLAVPLPLASVGVSRGRALYRFPALT